VTSRPEPITPYVGSPSVSGAPLTSWGIVSPSAVRNAESTVTL